METINTFVILTSLDKTLNISSLCSSDTYGDTDVLMHSTFIGMKWPSCITLISVICVAFKLWEYIMCAYLTIVISVGRMMTWCVWLMMWFYGCMYVVVLYDLTYIYVCECVSVCIFECVCTCRYTFTIIYIMYGNLWHAHLHRTYIAQRWLTYWKYY